jgi:hypothetical protein
MATRSNPTTRKARVKVAWEAEGIEGALVLGVKKLGLKEGTVRTWASMWKREASQEPKAKVKAKAKKKKSQDKADDKPTEQPAM